MHSLTKRKSLCFWSYNITVYHCEITLTKQTNKQTQTKKNPTKKTKPKQNKKQTNKQTKKKKTQGENLPKHCFGVEVSRFTTTVDELVIVATPFDDALSQVCLPHAATCGDVSACSPDSVSSQKLDLL